MFKKIILVIAAFVLLMQIEVFAEIKNSAHDFSSGPSFSHAAGGEICKICHTPHNAVSSEIPLWRINLESNTYTLYNSSTLNAEINQPLAPSKACLTCHDGLISSNKGGDCLKCHSIPVNNGNLNDDHPVSFTFDAGLAQVDGALNNPVETPVSSLGGKTIQQGMLYQNRMECISCHDVHATKGDSATAPHLLLVDNKDDKLCLTCHNK